MTGRVDLFISGGYYVVKPTPRPHGLSAMLPPMLISVSACIADIAPGSWSVDWGNTEPRQREEAASKFGIRPERLPELSAWITETPGALPNGLPSLDSALEFHRRFVRSADALVAGIGLHHSLLASVLEKAGNDVNHGYGLVERIREERPIAPGAALGFEPVGYDGGSFHSWLCNFSPEELQTALNIRPGAYGLFSDLHDAICATEYAAPTAEPGIWAPWLIAQY